MACSTSEERRAPKKPHKSQRSPQPPVKVPLNQANAAYCQVQVENSQARNIGETVVAAFNEGVAIPGGFPLVDPGETQQGKIPQAFFIDPSAPRLSYPSEHSSPLHVSLCYDSRKLHLFQCSNPHLRAKVKESSTTATFSRQAFENFYQEELGQKSFASNSPQVFGGFIALPLSPKILLDSRGGEALSGSLHVSLVQVHLAPQGSPVQQASLALKQQFLVALKQHFARQKAETLKFGTITCL